MKRTCESIAPDRMRICESVAYEFRTKVSLFLSTLAIILLFTCCAGIKYINIETLEPAQVTLPANIKSVAVVNNTAQQPDDIGHYVNPLGRNATVKASASSDSMAVFYTEALTQFLNEEKFFDFVVYYKKPLRTDNKFLEESPLPPDVMTEIKNTTGADAIVSLDKLLIQTDVKEHFRQEGHIYAGMKGKINSTIRVYLPTMDGKIPMLRHTDSLYWEGYDISRGGAIAEFILPTREQGMKEMVIASAEKMTYALSPHWVTQERWFYTSTSSKMKEAMVFADGKQWQEAVFAWKTYFDSERNNLNKAKAANNIALAYEMLDDIANAYDWAVTASDLFEKSTANGSLDRRRATLYKNELERRKDTSNKLNMQINR